MLQGGAPLGQQLGAVLVAGGVRVLRGIEVLVALQIDAGQLRGRVAVQAGMLALDEVGEARRVLRGGDEGRVQVRGVDAGGPDIGDNGCTRSCQGGVVDVGVDVCRALAWSSQYCSRDTLRGRRGSERNDNGRCYQRTGQRVVGFVYQRHGCWGDEGAPVRSSILDIGSSEMACASAPPLSTQRRASPRRHPPRAHHQVGSGAAGPAAPPYHILHTCTPRSQRLSCQLQIVRPRTPPPAM